MFQDLFRLILHDAFGDDSATEVCVSIRPEGGGKNALVSIATDSGAFDRLYEPIGKLRTVISETCRVLAVVCRDHAIVHRGAVSQPVDPSEVCADRNISSIGMELRSRDPMVYGILLSLAENLLPPPHIHLEVQGRHVHCRAPLRLLDLEVDDGLGGSHVITGELHNLPQRLHDGHDVKPMVLLRGVPVGPCDVAYQFNITSRSALRDSAKEIADINRALRGYLER